MSSIIPNQKKELVTYIDEVSGGLIYIGQAKLGSATSASSWQIRRIQKVGDVTAIQYADGDRRFDNSWDNRASLTYAN